MGANEKAIWTESMKVKETFASKQYYGCKMSGDREVTVMAADTDAPVGLLLDNPADEKMGLILIVGRAPGVVSEAIAVGQKVRIDANGKVALWATTDTTTFCIGQCIEAADNDGEYGVFNFNFPAAIDTA